MYIFLDVLWEKKVLLNYAGAATREVGRTLSRTFEASCHQSLATYIDSASRWPG